MLSTIFILCSWLFATTCAVSDIDVDDIEFSNFIENSNVAASPASAAGAGARWLLDQRSTDNEGWGSFTPRAVVALALAEGARAHTLPKDEWELLAKQLNVLLSIEVGRDVAQKRPLGVSRLAHFVNALYATCQDPRHFHGLDLVQKLRAETDAEVRKSGDHFSLPVVFVTLCLAGETRHDDLTRLSRMYLLSVNRTDVQALQLLAMSCTTSRPPFATFRYIFTSYLREFAHRLHASLQANTTDVFTKALAMQAINSGDEVVSITSTSSLLADQQPDGSFERSLLATYHAIPALLGTSILAIRDVRCPSSKPHADRPESFPQSSSSQRIVHLSLWIGEGTERDMHTVTVATGANDTLLDVMKVAQDRNNVFRFNYDDTPTGARVYSLAGIPNDSERQVTWQLYVQKSSKHEHLREIKESVDKVYPAAEEHLVFWFKRNSMQ